MSTPTITCRSYISHQAPTQVSPRSLQHLLDHHLTPDHLSDCLNDLPVQFQRPRPRPWQKIPWSAVNRSQIIGVDPGVFLNLVAIAAEVEAPIRGYALESASYLERIHPQMAEFMGGHHDPTGHPTQLGVWEKEERQHCPVFRKIYQQLSHRSLTPKPNKVQQVDLKTDPYHAIHRHLMGRITTEWSATSTYLWLMIHSTGALQQAIAQPLQDEINHLAKFWGFRRWLFGPSLRQQLIFSLRNVIRHLKHHHQERTHGSHLVQGMKLWPHGAELVGCFAQTMLRMYQWDRELSYSYLRHLFGPSPLSQAR